MEVVSQQVCSKLRRDLLPIVEESRQQVHHLVKLINDRKQGERVRTQLLQKWEGKVSPLQLLESLRPPLYERDINTPAICLWMILRSSIGRRRFQLQRELYDSSLNTIARLERMNIFLEQEKGLAKRYLQNNDLHDLRFRLQRHLSKREGFVRSSISFNTDAFIDAQFLAETLADAKPRLAKVLKEQYDAFDALETKCMAEALIYLQRYFRRQVWQRKFSLLLFKRREQKRRVRRSRRLFVERALMRREDQSAKRMQQAHRAASMFQKLLRAHLYRIHQPKHKTERPTSHSLLEENKRELTGAQRKKLEEERRQDEAIKAKLRAEIESEKRLAAWRCEDCAKLSMPTKRFKTWKDVDEHIQGHKMLQERKMTVKLLKESTRLDRLDFNLKKEATFLNLLKQSRHERHRTRYSVVLVAWHSNVETENNKETGDLLLNEEKLPRPPLLGALSEELSIQDRVLGSKIFKLEDGENLCGRDRRRARVRIDSSKYPKLISKRHALIIVERPDESSDSDIEDGSVVEDEEERLTDGSSSTHPGVQISENYLRTDTNQDGGENRIKFFRSGLKVHLIDLNSTNRTSVNGVVIDPDTPVRLCPGDTVAFGVCPDNEDLNGKTDVVYQVRLLDNFTNVIDP